MTLKGIQKLIPNSPVFVTPHCQLQRPGFARSIVYPMEVFHPTREKTTDLSANPPRHHLSDKLVETGIVEAPFPISSLMPLNHGLTFVESAVLDIGSDNLLSGISQQLIEWFHQSEILTRKRSNFLPIISTQAGQLERELP